MGSTLAKQISKMAEDTYNTRTPTPEQMAYLLDNLKPTTYLLRHHTVRNHPITFSVSGRQQIKAQAHRPWQIKIINDTHRNKAVIKSRQLGLRLAPL